MKIAVCGSDGSGKTEISNYLAAKYGLNLFEDYLRVYVKQLGFQTFFEVPDKWKFFNKILSRLEKLHNYSHHCVFDRSAIDYWVIWQRWCWGNYAPERTTIIFDYINKMTKKYDKVFILPVNLNASYDSFRYINKDYAHQYWLLVKCFTSSFPKITKFYFVKENSDIKTIKQQVDSSLQGLLKKM